MTANGNSLASAFKRGADAVAQGLELKPVSGPVKNVTGWIAIIFTILVTVAKSSDSELR